MTEEEVNAFHQLFREANHPGTSPNRLAELAFSDDEVIVAAVAANPSTPLYVVEFLKNHKNDDVQRCLNTRK